MIRKRAPRACNICRGRKVRCDVSRTGIPCSNCLRASATCAVDCARREKPTQQASKITVPRENVHTFRIDLAVAGDTIDHETGSTGAPTLERAAPEDILTNLAQPQSPGEGDIPEVYPPQGEVQLPDYITPLAKDLDQDIFHLLRQRGALTLPNAVLIDELLRGFVCYVYPMLPILDLGEFLQAIEATNSNTISLVLLQAVLFAGIAFADIAHLQKEGFQSHKEARKTFFERVKLLYEMDVESNPTTMIQVLLLMTYWYGQQNDTKGRFYWLRTALSLSTDIGLDRQHQFQFPDQPNRQRTRRKLWYCCLIRDKLLSITERRQNTHHGKELSLSLLQADDFEDPALTQALKKYYMPGCDMDATSMGRFLRQKIKLCLIIGRILGSQYELSGLRRVDSSETFMVLIPKVKAASSEAAARDQELRAWYAETSSILDTAFGHDHRRNGRVLGVHSASLELLYYTALCAVHRAPPLQDQPKDSAAGALQVFSRHTLRSAARRISEIGRHLDEGNLIRFLPPLAVGAFITASIQHLKDALSGDAELRGTGRLYLSQTLQVFATLRKVYNSADCAMGFIERVQSGGLPYQSFEWEDRARFENLYHGNLAPNSYTEPGPNSVAETTTGSITSLPARPNAMQQDIGPGVTEIARSTFTNEEDGIRYSRVPSIETISEVLLSAPFDADDIDWTSMDWSCVETMAN